MRPFTSAQRGRGGSVAQRSPRAPLMIRADQSRRTLEDITGGPVLRPAGLGDLTSSAIGSSASMAATGAMVGAVAGPVGMAIGAAVGAAVGFLASLFGSSTYHKEEAQATKIVNLIETEMHSSLARYQSGLHEYSQQQAMLAYWDQLWAGIIQGCTDLGTPGQRCVSERQRGGKYDYFAYSRDPIQNDSKVVADSGYQLVVDATGAVVGEVPVGYCAPDQSMSLVPQGYSVGSGKRMSCATDAASSTQAGSVPVTTSTEGTSVSTPVASVSSNISLLGYSVNPLMLAGAAVALVLVMGMGGKD